MANTFSSAGQTLLNWSLSDSDTGASRRSEQRIVRTITNGTGPGQATVGYSTTFTTTGTGGRNLNSAALAVSVLDVPTLLSFSRINEMLVAVTSGPAGGHVLFGAPTGPAGATGVIGVAVRVGGQFHWADYGNGITPGSGGVSPSWTFANGVSGTYSVEFSAVGVGSYFAECP